MTDNLEIDLAQDDFSIDEAWALTARCLRQFAGDADSRNMIQRSTAAMTLLEPAARLFIAGLDRAEALTVTRLLADDSVLVSIDYMGEDTRDADEVEAATQEFLDLIDESARLQAGSSISLNLSHIGLAVDRELAIENCRRIVEAARVHGIEVILNMEGDAYRSEILSTFWALGLEYASLGITLQACIVETDSHLTRSLELPGRIRLVKGAYDELGEGAIRSEHVNQRFRQLTGRLIEAGHRASIATHDPELLMDVVRLVGKGTVPTWLEFEMLYGVAQRRLLTLRDHGFPVRVYLPYGTDWLLYLCHRMAEYPPNLHFALAEVVPGLTHHREA